MDELRAIREYLEDIPGIKKDVAQLKIDVAELKIDREWIKRMLTKHDARLDDYAGRLSRLEHAR